MSEEKKEKLPLVVHSTKYLEFIWISSKPKTKVFAVVSVNHGDELGRIEWYSRWRQYCFMPHGMTIWNTNCLKDIENFITTLMISRRPKPKTIGVVCRDMGDFLNWSKQKKHKRKSVDTIRKYVHGTTTYVAFSQPNHCCGYSIDKIVETDEAHLNPIYNILMQNVRLCLNSSYYNSIHFV